MPASDVRVSQSGRSERLNVRLSVDALMTLREAALLQQQDMTSFVLGAALDRAREILIDDRLMRLTLDEVQQLEEALERAPAANTVLSQRLKEARAARRPT